jgi:hypothetical protein
MQPKEADREPENVSQKPGKGITNIKGFEEMKGEFVGFGNMNSEMHRARCNGPDL